MVTSLERWNATGGKQPQLRGGLGTLSGRLWRSSLRLSPVGVPAAAARLRVAAAHVGRPGHPRRHRQSGDAVSGSAGK